MFVVSDEDDVDGMQDAGVALVRAYNYITDEVDSHSAFEAVISVSICLKISPPVLPPLFNTAFLILLASSSFPVRCLTVW